VLVPVPDGEYLALTQPVDDAAFREFDITKGERAGTKGYGMKVKCQIQDEKLKEQIGREPSVVYDMFLDTTPTGGLDFGKQRNVKLGRLLEAVGLNGKPWNFQMLGNQLVKVRTKQRMDGDRIYVDVVDISSPK